MPVNRAPMRLYHPPDNAESSTPEGIATEATRLHLPFKGGRPVKQKTRLLSEQQGLKERFSDFCF